MKKIMFTFGTRPEAIKMAPVIRAFQANPEFRVFICVTGQHREMLQPVFAVFGMTPDVDFELMRPDQTLAALSAATIEKMDACLAREKPDLILVQGDTTTVFCTALTAFYHQIPVGHIEAGLRTGNLSAPWPEEANRVLTTRLAALHFAPTETARENLLQEHVPAERIVVTGNTVIDALLIAKELVKSQRVVIPELPEALQPNATSSEKMVLITGHRRENFGTGFQQICHAIEQLAQRFPEVSFVYPVHLNPHVQQPVRQILGEKLRNVYLIPPQPYLEFVGLMHRSTLILTDSGGVQEEAPTLGKPVLVMRNTTERPEAIAAGTSCLVGTQTEKIFDQVSSLLTDTARYQAMSQAANPYGDGLASKRIVAACEAFFQRQEA